MSKLNMKPVSLDRMVRAVEKVRQRLLRSTAALENSGIPYAVIGGNAVAAWVSRVDEAAVRNTQDVDILIRRIWLRRQQCDSGYDLARLTVPALWDLLLNPSLLDRVCPVPRESLYRHDLSTLDGADRHLA